MEYWSIGVFLVVDNILISGARGNVLLVMRGARLPRARQPSRGSWATQMNLAKVAMERRWREGRRCLERVSAFAVLAEIESLEFLFRIDPEAHGHVQDFENDPGHAKRETDGSQDADRLDPKK